MAQNKSIIKRNSKGHYQPGECGNPNGRPKKPRLPTVRDSVNNAEIPILCYPNGTLVTTKNPKKIKFLEWIRMVFLQFMASGCYWDVSGCRQKKLPLEFMKYFGSTMSESFQGGQFDVLIEMKYPNKDKDDMPKYIKRSLVKLKNKLDSLGDILTSVVLEGWQTEAVNCDAEIHVMYGGRGAGRTVIGLVRIVLLPAIHPGTAAVVVRKAREHHRRSTFAGIEALVLSSPYLNSLIERIDRMSMIIHYKNGSKLFFAGLNNDSQRNAFKGISVANYDSDEARGEDDSASIGGAIDVILAEEADAFTPEDIGIMISSLRGKAMGFIQLMMNLNPSYPTHHIKTDWIDKEFSEDKKYDIKVFHKTAKDNLWLMRNNPDYWYKVLAGLSGVLGERLRDGLWRQAEGVVFQTYNATKHIKHISLDEIRKNVAADKVFVGIDTGATDATCVLWAFVKSVKRKDIFGIEVEKPHIFVYKEFYMWECNYNNLSSYILNVLNGKKVRLCVIGHDSKTTRNDLNKLGIRTIHNKALKGYTREDAINIINDMFLDERLTLCEDLTIPHHQIPDNLKINATKQQPKNKPTSVIDEIPALMYNDKGKPEDNNDHGVNALENLIMAVDSDFGSDFSKIIEALGS